ncbi:helix-turn-helix domain-containing protein [Bacillus pseudomycoides]|uniref:helix-turn-helix domain-containing protein n=1 Tax=Bacillus pseudomycoides TaxID=64104 RepID=UPI0015CF5E3D|nr:helix-turn-helix domain-containing protein [Bacillus pseudomycoides]
MLSSSGIHVHFPLHIATIEGKDIMREQLITKIWGYEFVGDDCIVNSHISKL